MGGILVVSVAITWAITPAIKRWQEPKPCSFYADYPRERVPAKCFGDFAGQAPSSTEKR